jgi:beta-galactosidase
VNSNADNVELFLNGKSQGKKVMPRNSHLEWDVSYRPGVIMAVAFKDGRKITSRVETTDAPVKVVLLPDRKVFRSNGKDVIVMNVSVADSKNREVPDAGNLIQFTIKGDAKILGVGNGDPSSHEPDKCQADRWQRKLFNGKCQVIIQSGTSPGIVEIKARSERLIPDSVSLEASWPR